MISILMPVKNAAPFLVPCLASIQQQSFTDWELLAVDDHSTDESPTILKTFARQDQRVKIYQSEHHGIIPALRKAFSQSQGNWISRMDADDRMPEQKLALMMQKAQEFGLGNIITGKVAYFSEQTLGGGYRRYQDWLNDLVLTNRHYEQIYKECVIPSPCWLLNRADLIKCGDFQPDRYPEDYDLCFRFYKAGLQVRGIEEILHYWRDHPTRTSRNDERYADIHYFDLKLKYFLELDRDERKELILWGTGNKGKKLAKLLHQQQQEFTWVTDNEKKIDQTIYDSLIVSCAEIPRLLPAQVIIAIAAPAAQVEIKQQLKALDLKLGEDYFFFC